MCAAASGLTSRSKPVVREDQGAHHVFAKKVANAVAFGLSETGSPYKRDKYIPTAIGTSFASG